METGSYVFDNVGPLGTLSSLTFSLLCFYFKVSQFIILVFSIYTVQMFVDDVKSEVRSLRKDVDDLKLSLQFTQGQVDDHKKISETTKAKMNEIENRVKLLETNMDDYYSLEGRCVDLEEKQDYLENMSRRNNIKILGFTEDTEREKTWEDKETLVKKTVREQLHVEEEILIERAHRVGKPRPLYAKNSGTNRKVPPRPVVVRLT